MSFPDALARLDGDRLTALLAMRPDVLVEPVPHDLAQLAQRLGGATSIHAALERCDRDMVLAARAAALLDTGATDRSVATLLGSDEAQARVAVDALCERGLAWRDGAAVALPERLAEHLRAGFVEFRPVEVIGRQANVDDVRVAVAALGGVVAGLRKPELVERLAQLSADRETVIRALAGLSTQARGHLGLLRRDPYFMSYGWQVGDSEDELVRAGLLVRVYRRGELPREVAVALWSAEHMTGLTGRPELALVEPAADDGHRSAAEGLLRGLTALLDEARTSGLASLKKGGVGARERTRLAKLLTATAADVGLWIDLASAAGLLAHTGSRYAPTAAYDEWRESEQGDRWAAVATGWWDLDFAPTYRKVSDDSELAPPLPLGSAAGMLRRALLRAAADGHSVQAAAAEIDWFCPMSGYPPEDVVIRVRSAIDEARAIGVVVGDAVSELGQHLLRGGADLGRRCAKLLPEAGGAVVLQSDLTAVVSGQPSSAAARLLAAAAVGEHRGVATTWRFTPASVRAAFDAGWTADRLLDELRALSDRRLPQPLEYLIADVARRHGSVRVRTVACCLVGSESEIAEILHTRSLRGLGLAPLAPTVLASASDVDEVLARLRAAGFAPSPEDADGVLVVEERPQVRAPDPVRATRSRPRIEPATLARRLLGGGPAQAGATHAALAALTSRLDSAEIALLADAIDHQRDVSISYRDKQGNRTVREIAPRQLHGHWIDSWCRLKNAQRDFT
ncbi:MAG: helicase-associated domain-containing protein, partial [Pseudonocardia sp.]|nr:helicase-associated domain-containing protein [Pseudonocardia sp.]